MDKPAPRIIIVEDEGLVALDLKNRLTKFGYTVPQIFDTGEEAVAAALAHAPDLILMDIRLKGELDGIETALHNSQADRADHNEAVDGITKNARDYTPTDKNTADSTHQETRLAALGAGHRDVF